MFPSSFVESPRVRSAAFAARGVEKGTSLLRVDDVADLSGFPGEGWVVLDQPEDLVVSDGEVILLCGLLDEVAFEAELGPLVDDVDAVLVEGERGHTERSDPEG